MAIGDSQVGLLFKLKADTQEAKTDVAAFKNFILNEVRAMEASATQATGKIGQGLASLGGGGGGLALVAAAATAAAVGIFKLAESAAKFSDGLVDLNAKTNVSIETLSVLKHNAELAGTDINSIGASLVIFEKNLAKAANGSDEMSRRLKALGVDLKQGVEPNLLAVFEKLGKMEDGYRKTELAMSVFGRQGASILALLKQMDNDFEKAAEEARRLGLEISTGAAKAADDFSDALHTLQSAIKGLQAQIGQGIIPMLTDLVKWFTNVIVAARQAASWIRIFKDALASKSGNGITLGRFGIEPGLVNGSESSSESKSSDAGIPAPSFPKGGSGGGAGKKDITEAQLAVKLLKVQQDEAQRAYNGTREAARRLLDITLKLIEAETREANERLPNKAAARLAEVRNQQAIALEKYGKQLSEVSDVELKHMEDLSKLINAQVLETEKAQQEANDFIREQYEIEADTYRRRATLQQQFLGTFQANRKQSIANIAALEIDAEEKRFERLRQEFEREMEFLEESDERRKALKDRLDAEEAEKDARVRLIRRQAQIDQEREQPNSNRNLLGAGIADALQDLALTNELLGQQTTFWQQLGTAMGEYAKQLEATLPNAMQLATLSLMSMTEALSNTIEAFLSGRATLRQAIGGLVQALLAPYKQYALTKVKIHVAAAASDFAWGNFAGGAKHLGAAALWAGVAGLIGAVGNLAAGSGAAPAAAAAPSAGGGSSQQQTRIIEQGDRQRPQQQVIIIRAETEPGVIVRRVVEDYQNNGASRQMVRRDVLGETAG